MAGAEAGKRTGQAEGLARFSFSARGRADSVAFARPRASGWFGRESLTSGLAPVGVKRNRPIVQMPGVSKRPPCCSQPVQYRRLAGSFQYLLFRWFLDMGLDEEPFVATTLTQNRERVLENELGAEVPQRGGRTCPDDAADERRAACVDDFGFLAAC